MIVEIVETVEIIVVLEEEIIVESQIRENDFKMILAFREGEVEEGGVVEDSEKEIEVALDKTKEEEEAEIEAQLNVLNAKEWVIYQEIARIARVETEDGKGHQIQKDHTNRLRKWRRCQKMKNIDRKINYVLIWLI